MSTSTAIARLIEEFARLPGIGPKTAERLTHHLLQTPTEQAMRLARAIEELKRSVRQCQRCFHLTEGELCDICAHPQRDPGLVCVVEQSRDLLAIERTAAYRGLYHVLLGRIAPLDGVSPDQLTIGPLLARVRQGTVREVILATNPTTEGDGTALYLSNVLADLNVRVTRLARGLATGSVLEFANAQMVADALSGRRQMS